MYSCDEDLFSELNKYTIIIASYLFIIGHFKQMHN